MSIKRKKVKSFSHVRLFATPWTVAYQAPLSMEFSGKNIRAGCHFFLQGIFPTQGLNLGLPHCRQMLYQLSHQGSPDMSLSKCISIPKPIYTEAHYKA